VFAAAEKECPSARLLFVSAGAVYGKPLGDELPITESSRLSPATPYAQSKLAADLLALRLAQERHLPFVVVRSFNHIGPRQQGEFAIAEFASQIADLEVQPTGVLRCGRLDVLRDFLDVRDVVRAYRMLIARGNFGEVYNLASGRTFRLGEMLDELLRRARRTIVVEQDESRLRSVDPPAITVDPSKLVSHTGWEPQRPIADTLADVLEYSRTIRDRAAVSAT
jgi:GDP-4-dehydro-6-deoxy-D-mannose reductase